jgi:hypothetical protein
MDALHVIVWAVTAAGLGSLAWALFTSDRLAVRVGALGAFALFYVAMVLWTPTDQTWASVTIATVLIIALGSRTKKPSDQDGEQ